MEFKLADVASFDRKERKKEELSIQWKIERLDKDTKILYSPVLLLFPTGLPSKDRR